MRLLDKPFNYHEKRGLLDMLDGNINRICVSDDPEEVIINLGFAVDRLSMLASSRIKQIKESQNYVKSLEREVESNA